jgi:DNA-binding CsgD family transcriptional regulator
VPVLFVLNTGFPPGSVLANYSGSMTLHGGIAGGGSWYMFDWRGLGKSTLPPGPVAFSDLVDDLEAVALAIGRPFDMNAVNDGCGMALAFAARRPDLVRRILLVAPQGPEANDLWRRTRADEVTELDRRRNLTRYLMWVHPGTDPGESMEVSARSIACQPAELASELWEVAANVDLLALGRAVSAPSLVLYTGGLGHEHALDLSAALPRSKAANWIQIGDGTINGAAWRKAWDEAFPPGETDCQPGLDRARVASALTPRELDVLAQLCRGLSNAEIAETLVIAPSTAKRHVANIFAKLAVATRPQAIALAYERGLVSPPARAR